MAKQSTQENTTVAPEVRDVTDAIAAGLQDDEGHAAAAPRQEDAGQMAEVITRLLDAYREAVTVSTAEQAARACEAMADRYGDINYRLVAQNCAREIRKRMADWIGRRNEP